MSELVIKESRSEFQLQSRIYENFQPYRQNQQLMLLTSLKQLDGFLSISNMAHFTVACRMFASYSLELAVPEGVPRDLS